MTKLGKYFELKCIKQADISRKTGLSTSRINQLALNETAVLKASELYIIALAMDVKPCDMLEALYSDLKRKSKNKSL